MRVPNYAARRETSSPIRIPDNALDVVQRAQGVPSYSRLMEDAVESELLGTCWT
jgi:hypothetical protein